MSSPMDNKANEDTMNTGESQGDSMCGTIKSTEYFKKHTLLDKSRNNITDVVKEASEILHGPDNELEQNANTLPLIKENMETNSLQFATATADNTLQALPKNILDHENKGESDPKSNTESIPSNSTKEVKSTQHLEVIEVKSLVESLRPSFEKLLQDFNYCPFVLNAQELELDEWPPEKQPQKPLTFLYNAHDLEQQKKFEEMIALIESLRPNLEKLIQLDGVIFYNAQDLELDEWPPEQQNSLTFSKNAQEGHHGRPNIAKIV